MAHGFDHHNYFLNDLSVRDPFVCSFDLQIMNTVLSGTKKESWRAMVVVAIDVELWFSNSIINNQTPHSEFFCHMNPWVEIEPCTSLYVLRLLKGWHLGNRGLIICQQKQVQPCVPLLTCTRMAKLKLAHMFVCGLIMLCR